MLRTLIKSKASHGNKVQLLIFSNEDRRRIILGKQVCRVFNEKTTPTITFQICWGLGTRSSRILTWNSCAWKQINFVKRTFHVSASQKESSFLILLTSSSAYAHFFNLSLFCLRSFQLLLLPRERIHFLKKIHG